MKKILLAMALLFCISSVHAGSWWWSRTELDSADGLTVTFNVNASTFTATSWMKSPEIITSTITARDASGIHMQNSSGTETFTIADNGNVQVTGNIVATRTSNSGIVTAKGASNNDGVVQMFADFGNEEEDKWNIISQATDNKLLIQNGRTGGATTLIHVSTVGYTTFLSSIVTTGVYTDILGVNTIAPSAQLEVLSNSASDSYAFKVSSQNATNMFTVEGNGNVGIGATNPGARLEINGGILKTGSTTHATLFDTINNLGFVSKVNSQYSVILGGLNNEISNTSDDYATLCGGESNYIESKFGFLGGGNDNTIDVPNYINVSHVTLCGGQNNSITGSGGDGQHGFLGGGSGNKIRTGQKVVLCGGRNNEAFGSYSSIVGGDTNISSGTYSMIPGGLSNESKGNYSFAAGRRAKALANGVFALTDSTNADFSVSTADVLGARFNGGYWFTGGNFGIGIESPTGKLVVSTGTASYSLWVDDVSIAVGIGTDSPTATLEVDGVIKSTGAHISTGGTGITFGDADSYIYESADDRFTFHISTSDRLNIGLNYLWGNGYTQTTVLYNQNTSSTVPVFVPRQANFGTGIGAHSNIGLSLIANSNEMIRVNPSSATVKGYLLIEGSCTVSGRMNRSVAEYYISSADATANVTDIFIPIAGTYTEKTDILGDWSVSGSSFTYAGTVTRTFKITAHGCTDASAATVATFQIAKNNVLETGTDVDYDVANNEHESIGLQGLVSITTGDIITIQCATNDGDDLTVDHLNIIIEQID